MNPTVLRIPITNLKLIGKNSEKEFYQGGFSGLFFLKEENQKLYFLTHTDRGPNGEPSAGQRPFLLPNFQPEVLKIEVDLEKATAHVVETIKLWKSPQKKLTGRPNIDSNADQLEEIPVNLHGKILKLDPLGLDAEGLVFDGKDYWLSDEYRPSLSRFAMEGDKLVLKERYVPKNSQENTGIPSLPEIYGQRDLNNGFEALAYAGGKIYMALQSPLPKNKNHKRPKSNVIRILEFDTSAKQVTGEYVYLLSDRETADKIGDMTHLGDLKFAIIEQNGEVGKAAIKNIFEFDLAKATNTLSNEYHLNLEKLDYKNSSCVIPAEKNKEAAVALHEHGVNDLEKIEGIATFGPGQYAIINDNDFGLAEGKIDPSKKSYIVIVTTN